METIAAVLDFRTREYLASYPILDLSRVQQGFRKAGSIPALIPTLEVVHRHAALSGRPVYALFVDFSNAFSSLSVEAVELVFSSFGVYSSITRLLSNRIRKATLTIRGGATSFPVKVGLPQGVPISPLLFTLALEASLRLAKISKFGYKLDKTVISHLAFADDLTLLFGSMRGLQRQVTELQKVWRVFNLRLVPEKTHAMAHDFRGGRNVLPKQTIMVDGKTVSWLTPGEATEPFLGVLDGPPKTKSQLLSEGVTRPKSSISAAAKEFCNLLWKELVMELPVNKRVEILKVFLLPRIQHTLQCACAKVSTVEEAEVVIRE